MRILPTARRGFPQMIRLLMPRAFTRSSKCRCDVRPDQYLWSYKRFKLPGPDGDPYRRRASRGNEVALLYSRTPVLADRARTRAAARARAPAFSVAVALGATLGTIVRWLPLSFVPIARRNLQLCLPELDATARERLLSAHFRSLGISMFETAIAWWSSDARLRRLARVEGIEHLQRALEGGHGAILLLGAFHDTRDRCARAHCRTPGQHHVSAHEERAARPLPGPQSQPAHARRAFRATTFARS